MKKSSLNGRIRQKTTLFFSISILPILAGSLSLSKEAKDEVKADNSLLYHLDFSDKDNLGKNTAGTSFKDAASIDGNTLKQNEGTKGKKGITFPGKTKEVNYLSLPTEMFENQDKITISGWFYQEEDVGTYLGEFGIYSDETRATFRAEPYANYHGDSYLYMVGDCDDEKSHLFNVGVKPVYNAWYHMTYEFDGENHEFKVYQNGELALTKATPETFSPKDFYSATSHFYLGQSAFMGTDRSEGKDDYQGKMSDIRVYSGLLDKDSIQKEYGLSILDFKYDEYTFDSSSTIYQDNIRGYSLKENNKTPSVEEGALRVKDGSAVYFYDKKSNHNNRMFSGFHTMTLAMDITIHSEDNWKRALDFYISADNRITEMVSCPGISENVLKLCYNYKDTGDNWIMDGNGEDISHLNVDKTYNVALVFHERSLDFYLDGIRKSTTALNDNIASYSTFFYDLVNGSEANATLGKNTYEDSNYADASFDNIRIYGAACEEKDIQKAIDGDIKHSLTLLPNTEGGEKKVYRLKEGESLLLSSDLFRKEGYTLKEFNTKEDGTGISYAIGTNVEVSEDLTLYAIWKINSHQVTFVSDSENGEMAPLSVNYGEEGVLPECGFAKVGYRFKEYNTKEDGSGTSYHSGDRITLEDNLTLYVLFEAKTFSLTILPNGGEGEEKILSLTYDSETLLPSLNYTKKGYRHVGYALTKEGIATLHTGDRIDTLSVGEDITLYAVYEKKTLTVTFDADGGTGTMEPLIKESLSLITLPKNTFEKEGYDFIGWSKTKGGAVEYQDEEEIELIDEDVMLYAVWEKKEPPLPTTDNTSTEETPAKKGCFGSVMTLASLPLALSFTLIGLMLKKKKEEK